MTDIFYLTDQIGFASGYGAEQFSSANIFKTVDGGKTWEAILESAPSTSFDEIQFISEEIGFAVSTVYFQGSTLGKDISKTTDGGKTWEIIYTHNVSLGGAWFIDENKGFLVDANGEVQKTTDGGKTWELSIRQADQPLFGIEFTNGGLTGMAVGAGGTALLTTNGGRTWKRQTTNSNNLLIAVRFFNQRAYCIGANGTLLWDDQVLGVAETSMYPRPVVSVDGAAVRITGVDKNANIQVWDIQGRQVPVQVLRLENEVQLQWETAATAFYVLTVTDPRNGRVDTFKLLKG